MEAVIGDAYEQPLEERTEKVSTDTLGEYLVDFAGVFEEVDVREDFVDAVLQLRAGAVESLLEGAFVQGDVFEAFVELGACDGAFCCEVDQALFLSFDLLQLPTESVFFLVLCGLHALECAAHLVTYFGEFVGVKLFCCDGPFGGCFDVVQANGADAALPALFRGADVVLVGAAVPGVPAADEATEPSLVGAFGAVQEAAPEVEVDPVAIAAPVASIEHLRSSGPLLFPLPP
ncbi:hypothetical protein D1J51_15500 [Leucobacter sp. wl10]|nr:hypothetical protein D1J51_15500 [Leucobacter sp. wl10]